MSELLLYFEQILEQCNVASLVSLVLVNKHIHSRVMCLLKDELYIIRLLSELFYGDIYQGIYYFCTSDDTYNRYALYHKTEIKRFTSLYPNITNLQGKRTDLMAIYVHLYKFNIDTEWLHIINRNNSIISADFAPLISRYYNKMPRKFIKCLICRAIDCNNLDLLKDILEKGYDVKRTAKYNGIFGKYHDTLVGVVISLHKWSILFLIILNNTISPFDINRIINAEVVFTPKYRACLSLLERKQ